MTLHHGDCLDVMAGMEPESVDAIVTDPPYGLAFMGKAWDHGAIGRPFADAMLRVAKPSAYLLAFGGTRTVHRMTVALEDAGWIIRDMLVWAYASGFPKSKASLKPAWEPIVMARKPGPLRMLAIDECRIGRVEGDRTEYGRDQTLPHANVTASLGAFAEVTPYEPAAGGRWPANVILTDPIFDGGIEGVVGGGDAPSRGRHFDGGESKVSFVGTWRAEAGAGGAVQAAAAFHRDPDSGTYSRFFLIPKAARSDREPVLGGLPLGQARTALEGGVHIEPGRTAPSGRPMPRANVHPTVKPVALMRHLIRLVTPTGGRLRVLPGRGVRGAGGRGPVCRGLVDRERWIRMSEPRAAVGEPTDPYQWLHDNGFQWDDVNAIAVFLGDGGFQIVASPQSPETERVTRPRTDEPVFDLDEIEMRWASQWNESDDGEIRAWRSDIAALIDEVHRLRRVSNAYFEEMVRRTPDSSPPPDLYVESDRDDQLWANGYYHGRRIAEALIRAATLQAVRERVEALIVEAGGRCLVREYHPGPDDPICETHSELLFDGACEDQPWQLLWVILALSAEGARDDE